jgi:peptide/nickel transport system substrate-binding protein
MRDHAMPTRRGLLAGAGALGLGTAGWPAPTLAQPGRPLTYGLSAFPPNLRPFEHTGAAARTVKVLTHRGLLIFGADGRIHPEVAESWERTDPVTYHFRIRDNAVFHNGDPVTAEDVQYSLAQIVATGSTAFFRRDFDVVEKVEALSPKTVAIRLKQPTASFAAMIASPHAPVISARAGAANPNAPMGCGPFTVAASERGVSLTFRANRRFYKPGLPKAEAVRFVVYADDTLRVAALMAGDVDIIEYVPWQAMQMLANNPAMELQSAQAAFMYLVFNMASGPFRDARIRRAVAHAINRDDIVKAAFLGHGEALDGLPIDRLSAFHDPATAHLWPYDPDRARALLREAGGPNVAATLLSTATYGMHKDTAEIIQQHCAEIGMQVQLSLPEWGARVTQGNQGRYQFAVNGGGGEFGDPDELTPIIGSGSPSYRRSFGMDIPRIDALLARARHETDEAARRAAYAELSRAAAEEVPICSLNYRTQAYAMRRAVREFRCLPGFLLLNSGSAFDTAYLA